MNRLSDEAKLTPLSLGLSDFISIYNQMRKSPHRAAMPQKKHVFMGLKNTQKNELKCVAGLAPYPLGREVPSPEAVSKKISFVEKIDRKANIRYQIVR